MPCAECVGAVVGGAATLPLAGLGFLFGDVVSVFSGHLMGDASAFLGAWAGFFTFAGIVVCGGAFAGARISRRLQRRRS